MFKYLALIAGLVFLSNACDAQSRGTLRPDPATNVVIFITDDTGLEDLNQGCATATGCNSDASTTPALDTVAASGLVMQGFFVTPQCNSTRTALMTGNYSGQSWNYIFNGYFSSAEPTLARAVEEVRPGVVTMHLGKGGWGAGTASGMCTDDSYTPCAIDADCGGTCDLASDPIIMSGFRYSLAGDGNMNPTHATLYSYTHTLSTRDSQSPFSISTSTNVVSGGLHRDEQMIVEFDGLWDAHPYEPKFAVLATHGPHDVGGGSFFDPTLAYPQATSSLASERAKYVDWVYDTVLGDALTVIGDIDTETCLVILGDNGAIATYVTQNEGGKFGNFSGGTEVGAIFSGACLRGGHVAGSTVDGTAFDLPDLHRFVISNFRAAQSFGNYPSWASAPEMDGRIRQDHSDDLAGYLWGYCVDNSPTCWQAVGDRYGAYWGGGPGRRTQALGDYRLMVDYDLTPDTSFFDMSDEASALCTTSCPDGLSGADLAGYNAVKAAWDTVEFSRPVDTGLVWGTLSWPLGNPEVSTLAGWEVAADSGSLGIHPHSYGMCTIVWNDTATQTSVEYGQLSNALAVTGLVTFTTAESNVADITCVDLLEPTNTLVTTFAYTVDP